MTVKEFLGYALGTAFVLAIGLAILGAIVVLIGAIPLMLVLFPLTAAVLGVLLLVGYLRHRRGRRGPRGPGP